jgi:hypothetical protein
MLLRHATLIRNLPGIERRGLLCSKSQGKRPVVWFHTPGKSTWALLHTIRRHGGRAEAVITLLVDLPRAWLRRNRSGLWYSVRGPVCALPGRRAPPTRRGNRGLPQRSDPKVFSPNLTRRRPCAVANPRRRESSPRVPVGQGVSY